MEKDLIDLKMEFNDGLKVVRKNFIVVLYGWLGFIFMGDIFNYYFFVFYMYEFL